MTITYSQNFPFDPPPPPGSGGLAPFSADNFAVRIIQLLPQAWFNDAAKTPGGNLWALVSGLSAADADQYSRIGSLKRALRMTTAETIEDLEVIARDFFGTAQPPLTAETIATYRKRIGLRLFLPGGTRDAIRVALNRLVGEDPVIIEPWNPGDCGAWDGALGWDIAGLWGDLDMPWQGFVQTRRPISTLVPAAPVIGGWDTLAGWDQPQLSFADPLQPQIIPDSVIYDTLNAVKPERTTIWYQIT